jgi:hypothetical protein
MTLPTSDIEWDEDLIAGFQRLYVFADIDNLADELMAKRGAYSRVRDKTVIKMQIRATYTGTGHTDYRILGMLNDRFRLSIRPDAVRPSIVHGKHVRPRNLKTNGEAVILFQRERAKKAVIKG